MGRGGGENKKKTGKKKGKTMDGWKKIKDEK